jgi:FlaA1/EpsC-like NDP-sugar epimerase
VPDVLAFADWPNAPFQDFSTEHVNFFSPTSLRNTFASRGFGELMYQQNAREQSHHVWMSNISAAFAKASRSSLVLGRDEDTKPALERYIAQCVAEEQVLLERLAKVAGTERPIIVWGVGTHTQRLLVSSPLRVANIVAFVDSNVGYAGKELQGVPVIAPDEVVGRSEAILISSRVFQHEIVRQIREDLRMSNDLILLYRDS